MTFEARLYLELLFLLALRLVMDNEVEFYQAESNEQASSQS